MRKSKLANTRRILLPTLLALASVLPLSAQQILIGKDNKTIAITTTDDASALADTAIVTLGFNSFGKDQDTTYTAASEISNAIVSAITHSGIAKDAIQSQDQSLTSLNPALFQDKPHYDEGMRFQFAQHWQVTVPADQAAKLLQLAITNGANNSGNIQWQLQHDDNLQAEAAQKALQHAREVAARMAHGLNATLGPLLYASNQTPPTRTYGVAGMAGVSGGSPGGIFLGPNLKPLAISPDRITRSATVYAVFAIE